MRAESEIHAQTEGRVWGAERAEEKKIGEVGTRAKNGRTGEERPRGKGKQEDGGARRAHAGYTPCFRMFLRGSAPAIRKERDGGAPGFFSLPCDLKARGLFLLFVCQMPVVFLDAFEGFQRRRLAKEGMGGRAGIFPVVL